MGGLAFSAGESPLHTPRMPKAVYQAVKDRCQRLLLDLYFCVASPIDGPDKKDFGDVDIALALSRLPLPCQAQEIDRIAKALKAERVIPAIGNGCAATMAIAWPSDLDDQPETHASQPSGQASERQSRTKFIQVDIHVHPSLEKWHWALFSHSHGDIWNILGLIVRPYGLTLTDNAMWLRVPELEERDRKKARIFLTSEPAEALAFLGLPVGDSWDRPFETLQDMYEYAARCRLMHVAPQDDDDEGVHSPSSTNLKSNDRRRMTYRAGFRGWVVEFVPQCRDEGRFSERNHTRADIEREAFSRFHVEEEYVRRREAFLIERQRDYIWNHAIKDNVPLERNPSPQDNLYRSCLVNALKRIILEEDTSYGLEPGESFRDEKGLFLMDRVLAFILTKQGQVGAAAMKRRDLRCAEVMRAKKARLGE